jgi:hypothetical protein
LIAIETRKVRGSYPPREVLAPVDDNDKDEGKGAEEGDVAEDMDTEKKVSGGAGGGASSKQSSGGKMEGEFASRSSNLMGEEKDNKKEGDEPVKTGADIATLFVTAEHGIQLQGTFPLEVEKKTHTS